MSGESERFEGVRERYVFCGVNSIGGRTGGPSSSVRLIPARRRRRVRMSTKRPKSIDRRTRNDNIATTAMTVKERRAVSQVHM